MNEKSNLEKAINELKQLGFFKELSQTDHSKFIDILVRYGRAEWKEGLALGEELFKNI